MLYCKSCVLPVRLSAGQARIQFRARGPGGKTHGFQGFQGKRACGNRRGLSFFGGVRLTGNWAYTFENLNTQDWRYSMLQKRTGKLYPAVNLLGIHLMPTMVVYFCALPALYAIRYRVEGSVPGCLFVLLSLCAAVLQGTADHQMHAFRKSHREELIRTGLWTFSRHPNYLGEILMWWGIGLSVVVSVPGSGRLLLGAVINTLLFLFISIPLAEERQSRKAGFEEYKKQTRMLLPLRR